MTVACRSPFRYIGGKFYLAKKIIPLLPEHTIYAEPFGGAGHVMMQKAPSPLEVYNDINQDMVNLFKVFQHPDKSKRLLELWYLTPHSREFFYQVRDGRYLPEADPDVQKAYKTFVLMKKSFSGHFTNRKASWKFFKQPFAVADGMDKYLTFIERLREIQIESLDFREFITKYDGKDTLFYVDPPYYDKEFYYEGGFSKQDHADLAELLNGIQGKAAVSYYHFPGVEDLYSPDAWEYHTFDTPLFSEVKNSADDEKRRTATELLLVKKVK